MASDAKLETATVAAMPSKLREFHPETLTVAHGVCTTAIEGRCTLKPYSLTPSRSADQVAQTMSAVGCAAVKTKDIRRLRLLGRDDVRNLCFADEVACLECKNARTELPTCALQQCSLLTGVLRCRSVCNAQTRLPLVQELAQY